MAVEQAIVFFGVFAYWLVRFFAEEEARQSEEDRLEAEYPLARRP
jgi:hypothetical protein